MQSVPMNPSQVTKVNIRSGGQGHPKIKLEKDYPTVEQQLGELCVAVKQSRGRSLSGKLWYLQHKCVGDTTVYH